MPAPPAFSQLVTELAAIDRQLADDLAGEDLAALSVVLVDRGRVLSQMEMLAAQNPQPAYLESLISARNSGMHLLRHLIQFRHGLAASLSAAGASRRFAVSLSAGAPAAQSVGLDCQG
jgi:hypothetical protein